MSDRGPVHPSQAKAYEEMSVHGRIPRQIARSAFCEKHQRWYREGYGGCFDCFMEQLDEDLKAKKVEGCFG